MINFYEELLTFNFAIQTRIIYIDTYVRWLVNFSFSVFISLSCAL